MTSATPSSSAILRPTPRSFRRWRRVALLVLLGILVFAIVLIGGTVVIAAFNTPHVENAPVESQTTQFDGRYLIVASDADMVGTAYSDGRLMQIAGDVDTLSLVQLPLTDISAPVIKLPVSNSVTSWPQIIAVAPDGNTIYVVETAGQVDDDVTQLNPDDFPAGRLLTVVDISEGADNAILTTIEVGKNPIHVAISADGAYLAIGFRGQEHLLAILPTSTLNDHTTFNYFRIEQANGDPSEEVTAVSWHPSGDFLAVGNDRSELQFFRVTNNADGTVTIASHGKHLDLGNTITHGQFTQDGQFYLTAEINWNTAPAPLGNLINPPGEMIVVRFDASNNSEHEEVSRMTVGLSPEGFAISPQEDLIVTVNMGRTYLPDLLAKFMPAGELNSLTLLSFDNQTGQLAALGEYGFEGVLPEDAMFDADGDALGVVIYNEREDPNNSGYVEFWNVIREGSEPQLERTAVRVPVVRGPHAIDFIP